MQNEGSPLAGGNYSSTDESGDFAYPIYTVNEVEKKPPDMDEWYENVNIDGHSLKVQIDTGSAQSITPYNIFTKLKCQQPLKEIQV